MVPYIQELTATGHVRPAVAFGAEVEKYSYTWVLKYPETPGNVLYFRDPLSAAVPLNYLSLEERGTQQGLTPSTQNPTRFRV